MFRDKTNKCSFRVQGGDFTDAYAFVEGMLSRKDVNDETAKETLLVFEALMQKLIDWGLSEDTDLEISGKSGLGEFRIKVGFAGKVYAPDDEAERSIEDMLLEAHDDKIDYSYSSGYNAISIAVSRSNRTMMFSCAIALLCAVVVYLPLSFVLNVQDQQDLLMNYVLPLEKLYTNAALMVGAPMTFFSLLKNLTNTYVVSQKSSGIRQLQAQTITTSVLAILLAFVTFFIVSILFSSQEGFMSAFGSSINRTFADIVTSLIPPSIFEPFEAISPVPLMVVALLCTYALCSAGKYFATLRHAMMACYTLFSRMLRVVIAVLPVFCFVAIMDVLLDTGLAGIVGVLMYFIVVYMGFLILFASYAIRIRARGVKVIPFVRRITSLLRENLRIGSAIDAAPYNIRYCSKNLKMNRAMLERNLPVLAEINLDGNCFILMIFTLMFIFLTGTKVPLISFFGLAALVLLLSFGAPNQPGSILIGTLIILIYLQSSEMLCAAIYSEAFLGGAQNLINVFGDIVMVAIEDNKEKAIEEDV